MSVLEAADLWLDGGWHEFEWESFEHYHVCFTWGDRVFTMQLPLKMEHVEHEAFVAFWFIRALGFGMPQEEQIQSIKKHPNILRNTEQLQAFLRNPRIRNEFQIGYSCSCSSLP